MNQFLSRRRLALSFAVLALLVFLLLQQFHAGREFHWELLGRELAEVDLARALAAVALIHLAMLLRVVRWQVLLAPDQPARFRDLVGPTFIGFAGLALLGRPAELVRPYLIARKLGVAPASQLGVWTLERVFDAAAVALLLAATFALAPATLDLLAGARLRTRGIALVMVALVALGALLLAAARFAARGVRVPGLNWLLEQLRQFHAGLGALRDPWVLARAAVLSLLMWGVIGVSYFAVARSFPELGAVSLAGALLVMGSSLVGSLVQLPGGGGAQVLAVAVVMRAFHAPAELAVSFGLLLWLATYLAPVPLGLWFAQREHLSLRKISEAIQSSKFKVQN